MEKFLNERRNFEQESYDRIIELYNKAQDELLLEFTKRVVIPSKTGKDIKTAHIKALVNQIHSIVDDLNSRVDKRINIAAGKSLLMSRTHVKEMFEDLKEIYPDSIPDGINFKVHIPSEMIYIINDSSKYLYKLNEETRTELVKVVSKGLIKGYTQGQIVDTVLTEKLPGTWNQNYRSVRGTISNMINGAYNQNALETMNKLSKDIPGLRKQWFSEKDNRTTDICKRLHNQTKPLEEPFKLGGWEGHYPPAIGEPLTPSFHYCRSTVNPVIVG